jgi:hypothetical protein
MIDGHTILFIEDIPEKKVHKLKLIVATKGGRPVVCPLAVRASDFLSA